MADRLNSSENLTVGSSITSEDGRFTLIMQGDGNLVLYGPGGRYRWDTGTGGRSVSQAIMQGDGNFVMYGPGGEYIWDTATNGHPGAWLIVQNDRNLVIYGADGSPLWATGTNSAILIVPPYLQLGNHGSALQSPEWCVVMWHTDNADVKWTVEFRQSPTSDWAQAVNVTGTKITVDKIPEHYVFRAELRNLLPGEEFEYRLLSGDEQVYPLEGVAKAHARKHCGPYRIAVMSDCGTDVAEEDEEQLEVANRIFEHTPDLVVMCGDIAYFDGRISDYRNNFFPIYNGDGSNGAGPPLLSSVISVCGLGAHDLGDMYTGANLDNMPDALAFFMYWDLPLNGPFLSGNGLVLRGTDARADAFRVHSRGQFPKMANYSFDIGNSHWTVLDTYDVDLDWSDPHLRAWLAADLAAAKSATWRFVSCYQSPFMSSNAEDKPNNPLYLWNKMRGIVDLFQEGGVDIVFGGCAHVYERLHPLWFTPNQVPTPLKDPFTKVDGVFQIDDDFVGDGGRRPEGVLYVVTGNGPWLGPNMTNQPYTNIYFPDPNNDANPPIKKSFTVLAGC